MKKEITLFNTTFEEVNEDWKEKWEVAYETDDELILISKKTYHNESEEIEFGMLDYSYKYVLRFTDMSVYDDCDDIAVSISMIPTIDCFHQDVLNRIDGRDILSAILEGYDIPFTSDTFEWKDRENVDGWFSIPIVNTITSNINPVVEINNTFFGFCMDKYLNRIGNTGWDYLCHIIFNVDTWQLAFKRHDEMKNNSTNI